MREETGDIFDYPADAIVIPTNWSTKRNGDAVMGAGVAKQAAERWPWLPMRIGHEISQSPKVPMIYVDRTLRIEDTPPGCDILGVPTKRHWRDPSSLEMIEAVAQALQHAADPYGWQTVVLPRLGCGLGGLKWSDVRPILARHLDDRFVVLTPAASPRPRATGHGRGGVSRE